MASNKTLLIIVVVAVALTAFAFCVAFNVGNLGTSLSGVGGPVAAGFYNLLSGIPRYALSGGWPTLAIVGLVFVVIIPCLAAYATWHYDIPTKFTGATASTTPASNYSRDMNREPEEPERQTVKPV